MRMMLLHLNTFGLDEVMFLKTFCEGRTDILKTFHQGQQQSSGQQYINSFKIIFFTTKQMHLNIVMRQCLENFSERPDRYS